MSAKHETEDVRQHIARLRSGGTVALTLDTSTIVSRMIIIGRDEWVTDDLGVMVNMTHVTAIVPATSEPESDEFPREVTDGEGDVWTRADDTDPGYVPLYIYGGSTLTLAEIRRDYGITLPEHLAAPPDV